MEEETTGPVANDGPQMANHIYCRRVSGWRRHHSQTPGQISERIR